MNLKLKFEHRINFFDLRDYCVKHNLCTHCTEDEYYELLKKYSRTDLTPEDVLNLAEEIYKYSDVDNERFDFGVEHFMHSLVYDRVVTLSIEG